MAPYLVDESRKTMSQIGILILDFHLQKGSLSQPLAL